MHTVNTREARIRLSELLTEAEHGQIVSITRHGREVARLVPPVGTTSFSLPDLAGFRNSIAVKTPTAETVQAMRREERY